MKSKIEKMNRMRRNILIGILVGWGTLCLWIWHPTIISLKFRWRDSKPFISRIQPYIEGLWILGLIILSIYIILFLIYRMKIRKDPFVSTAINDERVRLNWLRAYRFAFYALIGITIFWKWWETDFVPEVLNRYIMIIHGPWHIWFGSILALIGSFLYFNREVKDE